ncbi:hypothetical protein [Nodosilinea sp. E11]|uniref:hypothetical protein n=1 Tax=Nodosilinea sp. E11 TaxID=3037479 RepID=UPI0029344223|nr:hypothetical protein [Nodosilinea sp. E11]WOD37763.1 hypothetical protein RRF56_16250 [Nodosilinea sp. E11]
MQRWIRVLVRWIANPYAKPIVSSWLKEQVNSVNKYERWSLGIEVTGFIAVIISILLLSQQTHAQVESLYSSSYAAVVDKQLSLTSIFIEKPELGSYFLKNDKPNIDLKDLEESDLNAYYQAIAMADYYLDFFDLFHDQVSYFLPHSRDPKGESYLGWENYITESFKQSPILCQRLAQVQDWYTPGFKEFSRCFQKGY